MRERNASAGSVGVGALRARAEVYGFLSEVFSRPLSAAFLGDIRSPRFLAALSDAGVELDDGFAAASEAALLDRLAVDYTQLFHGPRGHISPYESVRTGHDGGELNGRATGAVRDFIAAQGLEFNAGRGELADHVAVELALLAELVRREAAAGAEDKADAARRWSARRRDFVRRHIGRWGIDFGRAVSRQAETGFYRELARLLADMLADELKEARPAVPANGPSPSITDMTTGV